MNVVVLALALALTGCASVSVQRIDPSWPDPVQQFNGDWKVIQTDQRYVALPYDQFMSFISFMGDMKRYTKDSTQMICYYRKPLNEDKCTSKPGSL